MDSVPACMDGLGVALNERGAKGMLVSDFLPKASLVLSFLSAEAV